MRTLRLACAALLLAACGGSAATNADLSVDASIDLTPATAIDMTNGDAIVAPPDLVTFCGSEGAACLIGGTADGLCNAVTGQCEQCNNGDDAKCDAAYGSAGVPYLCAAGHCAQGNCHDSSQCAGQICATNFCTACAGATAAAADAQCKGDASYGATYLCASGLCIVGDCHTDVDCTTGGTTRICGIVKPNNCGNCAADSDCQNDPDTTGSAGPNSMCNTTTGNCVSRACTAGTATCAAINAGDLCCGPTGANAATCQPGNCCKDGDCGGGGNRCSSTTQPTVAGVCGMCNAPTVANVVYVDPVNGSDQTGTGSNVPTGAGASCAFATVSRALQALGPNPTASSKVIVIGDSTVTLRNGATNPREQWPIQVPINTTITSSPGPVKVAPPANQGAFRVTGAASGINNFLVTGSGTTGNPGIEIDLQSGSTALSALTVTGFNSAGVQIKFPGTVNIGAGVVVNANGAAGSTTDGIAGDGTININVPAGMAGVSFDGNARYGIHLFGRGNIFQRGAVTASNNHDAGIDLEQAVNMGKADFDAIVVHGTAAGPGLRILAGIPLKLRNSTLTGNTDGVRVLPNGAGLGANNDVSATDLGATATGGDAGKNILQDGALPNSGAGICLAISLTALGNTGTLTARGNTFHGKDCSAAGAPVLTASHDCTGGVDVSILNPSQLATTDKIVTDNCTHP